MRQGKENLADIIKEYTGHVVLLHNTREKSIADLILEEGFVFENQLAHSTDRINPLDPVETNYFLFHRKEYGQYTIVIAIPKKTYDLYIKHSSSLRVSFEELITSEKPWLGDNDEYIYRLAPQHIAGYYDNGLNIMTANVHWSSEYIAYRDREEF